MRKEAPTYIKSKRLYCKIWKKYNDLQHLLKRDLQLQAQEEETKRDYYKAIDQLRVFLDNIN